MIRKCTILDHNDILKYISNEYSKCLYLYLNYMHYGLNNDSVKVWIEVEEEKIKGLFLKYYTGMHIFSRKSNINVKETISLILKEKPTIICAEKNIIQLLEIELKNNKYKAEYGWVRELTNIEDVEREQIQTAKENDFDYIVKLLFNDKDIGSSYLIDKLKEQIIGRNLEGYGRNYVIKKDNKVICHAGTGAENEKVAILNYVITDLHFRNKGLAYKLCKAICHDLITEGKTVYLINYSKESTALYDKLGFKISCDWGKLYIDLKGE